MALRVRRALLVFLLPGVVFSRDAEPVRGVFRSGGSIEMKLEAGEYDILPSSDEAISISLSGSRTEGVRVDLAGTDRAARLSITRTPRSDFRAVIRVPRTCDLTVRHSAGDLRIGPIQGNKDLRTRAGNLEVRGVDPADHARIDATVTAGEIDARPFRTTEGGLFNAFRWTGTGRYALKASLTAGDLVLKP